MITGAFNDTALATRLQLFAARWTHVTSVLHLLTTYDHSDAKKLSILRPKSFSLQLGLYIHSFVMKCAVIKLLTVHPRPMEIDFCE